MKLTKNYVLEGKCIHKDSEIQILKEEEFNDFLIDNKGNSIPKEMIDNETDKMLKSFETDTAFMQTNFNDLNIKDEMRKFIVSRVAQAGVFPERDVCLKYILQINDRNI